MAIETDTKVDPIAKGAQEIKEIVEPFVREEIAGIFPHDDGYPSKHHLLDLLTDNTKRHPKAVVLTLEGRFLSGHLTRRESMGVYNLHFEAEAFRTAPDLEVVKYSPRLMMDLFDKMALQLKDQEDPENVERVLDVLSKRVGVIERVVDAAATSLYVMGHDEPPYFIGDPKPRDPQTLASLRQQVEQPFEEELIPREMAAFNIYRQRESWISHVQGLVQVNQGREIKSYLRQITSLLVRSGSFPETGSEVDDTHWFANLSNARTIRSQHPVKKDQKAWVWGISQTGDVRELHAHEQKEEGKDKPVLVIDEAYDCPDDLIKDATSITTGLLNAAIARGLPKMRLA